MFTFTRDLLDLFDRRFQDVLAFDGRDFVLATRQWALWLQDDLRTRHVCAALIGENEAARQALQIVVAGHMSAFEGLRRRLSAFPETMDEPEPEAPVPDFHRAYSFRQFDQVCGELVRTGCSFGAFDPIPDPLEPLEVVLRSKSQNYREAFDIAEAQRESERERRTQSLESWSLSEAWDAYRLDMERLGVAFAASPGRALQLLREILLGSMTTTWRSPVRSWFDPDFRRHPDLEATHSDFVSALLTAHPPPSRLNDNSLEERKVAIEEWSALVRGLALQCASGIRARLGERALLVQAIDRFRLRSELHDVDRLRDTALAPASSGARPVELRLSRELARYLFDAGFNTLSEVPAGQGRADLVEPGEVYVEAKQISDSGNQQQKIVKGFHEAMDGVRQFRNIRAVVLAVYVLDGARYEPPALIPSMAPNEPDTYVIVIDLRLAAQRGSARPQASVGIPLSAFSRRDPS